uniref:RBR-type E3 ubiquitin transferase n=2 Tax=Lygus hesperus TaxID=30085 RepID=A0A146KLQ7_LYGHE
MSDEIDQSDEILALQSIYNDEEFTCIVGDDGLKTGKFSAFITQPSQFYVTFTSAHNGTPKSIVIPIEHLPPIILSFKFPKDYPSRNRPEFTLSCAWLMAAELAKLCERLETTWREKKCSVILYLWINILKEETLDLIGASDHLDITRLHEQLESPEYILEKKELDPRIADFPISLPLPQYLESFNEARSRTIFLRNIYVCPICFQETPGTNCLQFNPCRHVYCKYCMEQYFKVRITDVSSIPCPHEKCPSEATPLQVKELLGEQLSNKYDGMLLRATLDKMSDITYCPRLACGSPVLRDGDDKMAACLACNYNFCVLCRSSYHGVDYCPLRPEEVDKIIRQYQLADDAGRESLENQYGISRRISQQVPSRIEQIILEYDEGDDEVKTRLELRYGLAQIKRLKKDTAGELRRIVNQYQNGDDEVRCRLKRMFGFQEIQKLIKYNVNTVLSMDWLDRNAKNCPKCNAPIQKISGCNHMVCWKCKTSFCWHCLCFTCIG